MQDIRLIALDLDGTVFDDEKNISPRTLAALRAALDKGVVVIPATGRSLSGVPAAFRDLPGVRYALTSNGAAVVELATGRRLVNQPFDPAVAAKVYDIIEPYGGSLAIFIGGEVYAPQQSMAEAMKNVPANLLAYVMSTRIVVDDIHDTFRQHADEIEKFSVIYPDDATRDAAWRAVAAQCEVEITSSLGHNMEINAPGVTKGTGLLELARVLGLRRDQVMACGDSGNDLAMIRAAGLGVAMENAEPEIKAAADHITLDNNHDGVAVAIEKFVL